MVSGYCVVAEYCGLTGGVVVVQVFDSGVVVAERCGFAGVVVAGC